MKNITTYRVIYGDTDQMGVAYYANYLRWFEIGRTEFMRAAGIPCAQAERDGIFFPVTEVRCRYRRPALYDNLLRIETTVESLNRVALKFHYWIGLEADRATLASGWTKHACLDRNRKIARLPGPYARRLGIGQGACQGRSPGPPTATSKRPASVIDPRVDISRGSRQQFGQGQASHGGGSWLDFGDASSDPGRYRELDSEMARRMRVRWRWR